MRALRIFAVTLLAWLSAFAAMPDYFPLHPGNQWVYRCTGFCPEPTAVVGVSRMDYLAGRWYSLVEGFGGRRNWLRQDEAGTLWSLDTATGVESRWYAFGAAEGESYDTSIDPCSRRATVAAREERYDGPAGIFPWALRIVYPPGFCMDAGLTEEIFFPWTGLLRRTETTIAGPRTWDLIYARTGGVTVISQPELQFSIVLDRSVYTANLMPPIDPNTSIPRMTVRLSLRNTTNEPVTLSFGSGQRYDLELRDERGNVVYRWSDGRAFPMAMGEEKVGYGEKNYVVVARLTDKQGQLLPQGKYTAVGWITTSGQQPYKASAGFEIRHVH
ncbi:MAG TPA: BsuPI-related putative proteinase inhibitor [Bryobacteraceae bacterium]|nr:BsuPI-related putative proteinase inhibitor [Bryobacteraceae bacterium]